MAKSSASESTNKAKRDYDQGEITVHWDAGKCIHSANCVRELPQVFRPKARPWINVSNADAEALAAAVDTWPTGALAYTWADPERNKPVKTEGEVDSTMSVRVTANGPLEVSGNVEILDDDGSVIEVAEKAWLCRCGYSENKPFCDGSHSKAGFEDARA